MNECCKMLQIIIHKISVGLLNTQNVFFQSINVGLYRTYKVEIVTYQQFLFSLMKIEYTSKHIIFWHDRPNASTNEEQLILFLLK